MRIEDSYDDPTLRGDIVTRRLSSKRRGVHLHINRSRPSSAESHPFLLSIAVSSTNTAISCSFIRRPRRQYTLSDGPRAVVVPGQPNVARSARVGGIGVPCLIRKSGAPAYTAGTPSRSEIRDLNRRDRTECVVPVRPAVETPEKIKFR